jgi:hypothetical protein
MTGERPGCNIRGRPFVARALVAAQHANSDEFDVPTGPLVVVTVCSVLVCLAVARADNLGGWLIPVSLSAITMSRFRSTGQTVGARLARALLGQLRELLVIAAAVLASYCLALLVLRMMLPDTTLLERLRQWDHDIEHAHQLLAAYRPTFRVLVVLLVVLYIGRVLLSVVPTCERA